VDASPKPLEAVRFVEVEKIVEKVVKDEKMIQELEGLKVELANAHRSLADSRNAVQPQYKMIVEQLASREKELEAEVTRLNALIASKDEEKVEPIKKQDQTIKQWAIELIPGFVIGLGVGVFLCLILS
jgi:hypothetical protein